MKLLFRKLLLAPFYLLIVRSTPPAGQSGFSSHRGTRRSESSPSALESPSSYRSAQTKKCCAAVWNRFDQPARPLESPPKSLSLSVERSAACTRI